jgi:MFS family permease
LSTSSGLARTLAAFGDLLRGRILLVVVGGLICQFGLGYGYAWSHVLRDITAELGWTRAMFSTSRIPLMVMMAAASPVVGFAVVRFGARPILVGSVGLLFVAMWIQSRMNAIGDFWLGAGIQGIAAVGVGDVVVGAVVAQWVVRGRGLALGIVYAGANVAGTLLSVALPRLSETIGWREALFSAGAIGACVMLPFALWALREPRPGEAPTELQLARDVARDEKDLDALQAMRTRSFWILCFALASFFFVFVGVLDHLVSSLRDEGVERVRASDLFAIITFSAIFSKVGFGALADLIDHRRAMWLQSGMFAASTALLLALPAPVLTPIVLIGFGVSTAARDVIYPLIIDYCFGRRYLAEIYGSIMFLLWAGALGTVFGGFVFDRTGSYDAMFVTFGGLATASFIAVLFLRDERAARTTASSAPAGRS